MPRRPRSRRRPRRSRRRARRPSLGPLRLPTQRTRRRWRRAWRGLPAVVRWPVIAVGVAGTWLVVNGVFQVVRKPTELFFPISGVLHKTPTETWSAYGSLFRRHATDVVTADLLAALAQVEGSGNPVARTYWRWSLSLDPFDVYRPASSAVGMYQITDGTFEQARRFCIHDHRVVREGPWHDWHSCWFNFLYSRVVPSHAIELTAAYLHHRVERALERHPVPGATLRDKQDLAAMIHLCGASAGMRHARRGLRLSPGQRCGSHDLRTYLDKVTAQRARFVAIEAAREARRLASR